MVRCEAANRCVSWSSCYHAKPHNQVTVVDTPTGKSSCESSLAHKPDSLSSAPCHYEAVECAELRRTSVPDVKPEVGDRCWECRIGFFEADTQWMTCPKCAYRVPVEESCYVLSSSQLQERKRALQPGDMCALCYQGRLYRFSEFEMKCVYCGYSVDTERGAVRRTRLRVVAQLTELLMEVNATLTEAAEDLHEAHYEPDGDTNWFHAYVASQLSDMQSVTDDTLCLLNESMKFG